MQLALRVVEAAGAGPAVGAAVDGCVAVLVDARGAARRRAVERLVPARPSTNSSAPRRASGPGPCSSQPAADRGRATRARPLPERCCRAAGRAAGRPGADRRRRASSSRDLCGVGAPVRGVRCARHVGHRVTHAPRARPRHLGGKALLVGDDGAVLATGRAPCTVDTPAAGWAEARPEAWLTAARDAVAQVGAPEVEAIGLAGQMHGVVLCDEAGEPVRPAILWPDTRAVAEAATWPARGNPPAPGVRRADPRAGSPRTSRRPSGAPAGRCSPRTGCAWRWGAPPRPSRATRRRRCCGISRPTGGRTTIRCCAPVRPSGSSPGSCAPTRSACRADRSCTCVADTAAALLVAGERMLNLGTGAQVAQRVDEPLPAVEAPTCHRFRAAGDGWYALAGGAERGPGARVGPPGPGRRTASPAPAARCSCRT